MNSSKVFKKPGSFIPEKIIPTNKKPLGWKSETIPAGKQPNDAFSADGEYSHIPGRRHSDKPFVAGIDAHDNKEPAYKTDFSTPEAPVKDGDAPQPSIPGDDPPVKPEEMPDLNRLQEVAYNKGMQDGLKMAEEDFGLSTKALVMACEQVNSLRQTILNNSMDEMENLVLTIAEKIIRHSVTEQDRTIIDTVEEAIRQAVRSDELIIHVNPEDYDVIKAKSPDFVSSLSGLENIVVQVDPTIERGGCSIDSSTSTVDATMASQLQIIEEKIKGKT